MIDGPGLNSGVLNSTLMRSIGAQETQLRGMVTALGGKEEGAVTQGELLMLQQRMQQWTMMIELQATVTKLMADSLKSIIQKSG